MVEATSQLNETTWTTANLIDGVAFTPKYTPLGQKDVRRICDPSCGWSSRDQILPQEIVLAFHQSVRH